MNDLPQHLAELSPEKRTLFLQTLLAHGETFNAFPLSFAQQRLWFIDQWAPGTPAYHVPGALRLTGPLDAAALWRALQAVVQRHEILRTIFVAVAGQPLQVIGPALMLAMPLVDLRRLPADVQAAQVQALAMQTSHWPFELARGPLLRATLLRLSDAAHVLLLTLHHIVADGWSLDLLLRELAALYAADVRGTRAALPELSIQYADFAVWQQQWQASPDRERQLAYWRHALAGAPPLLALPADHARPTVPSFRGARQPLLLDGALADDVRALAQRAGVTLFMTLLAAFQCVLARHSGQSDVVVGTAIAGRTRAEAELLIGCFVNTLALRTDLSGDPPFRALLAQVRAVCLDAYANQDVPFEQVVATVQSARALDQAPLVQVLFALQPVALTALLAADVTLLPFAIDHATAKLDLTLDLAETAEGLRGWLEYSTDLFEAATITRLAGHLRALLANAVAAPARRLSALALLSAVERQQLLVEWNATQHARPIAECLPELIAAQAARTPDAIALLCETQDAGRRTDGADSSLAFRPASFVVHLTYGELHQRANQLAQYLRRLGVGPEALVGVCVERSFELVVGMLGVLGAGAAYVPLDPSYPAARLAFMLDDSQAAVLLVATQDEERTTRDEQQRARSVAYRPSFVGPVVDLRADWPAIAASPATPSASSAKSFGMHPSTGAAAHLAYVIYTSGSTGTPKGAAITNGALVNLLLAVREQLTLDVNDCWLAVTTVAFDIAALELFLPLIVGARVLLASRAVSADGAALASLLGRAGVTVMQATPATWRLLLAAGWAGQRGLRIACGGEALPPALADQLRSRGRQLWNMYGPTETTIWSSAGRVGAGPISLGRPLANTQLHVLDAQMQPVPIGVAGELFIGGAGLARGYVRRPDLTAERFVPNPFVTTNDDRARAPVVRRPASSARLYKTGDLVRYRADGALMYLGRRDQQIKLRGYRIELGEIAAALGAHPAVRASAAVARADRSGEQRLVGYVVTTTDDGADSSFVARPSSLLGELRAFLGERLPEYMLPTTFVLLDALPLTPNGKLDAHALPAPDWADLEPVARYVAPRTPVERRLAELWAEVLGVAQVGVDDNFFALGGHSLRATQISARLRDAFGVELPLRALFAAPTIAGLAAWLAQAVAAQPGAALPALKRAPRSGPQPLSFAQQRLWFLDRLTPGSPAYTIPAALRLSGRLDIPALGRSFAAIIRRHETLRTTVVVRDGQPMQHIAAASTRAHWPALCLIDLGALPEAARAGASQQVIAGIARQPFDLARGPLLRVRLLRLAADEHVLLVILHHIIADGWSSAVLIREVAAHYSAHAGGRAATLPALPFQYADYAIWQREWLIANGVGQQSPLQKQLSYWQAQLRGPLPLLALTTDRPRPAVQTFCGRQRAFRFAEALSAALQTLLRQADVTLFMLQLAAFTALLHRYTGQTDILVGTPIAGRTQAAVEGIVGCFVNTLVLRVELSCTLSFHELARRVRTVCLEAYAHQELPFEQLLEAVQPARDLSHTPLFQVLLVLENAPDAPLELPGLTVQPLMIDNGTAKFDLTMLWWERPGAIAGILEYNTDLFDDATMARLLGHFETLLAGIVAAPGRRLDALPLLTAAERAQLLVDWNDTQQAARAGRESFVCVRRLFEAQAARTPDGVAVGYADTYLTYRELNRRANQLARHLRGRGVGPQVRVGIAMERSLELVMVILAVLKAGGAYVPLDPAYPQERLSVLLDETSAAVLITAMADERRRTEDEGTDSSFVLRQSAFVNRQVVDLHADWPLIAGEAAGDLPGGSPPDQLVYVIGTSGSTGRPKGTGVAQRGVVNLLHWWISDFTITADDRVLLVTSLSFDLTQKNIFAPLLVGGTVHMFAARYEPRLLAQAVQERGITLLNCTPSALYPLVELLDARSLHRLSSLRYVFLGGEPIAAARVRAWTQSADCNATIVNTYGPTECTDIVASYRLPRDGGLAETPIPIGRPVFNTALFVVDAGLRPLPIGVAGELCVAGAGVGLGYLGRPERTAERFVPNPFAATNDERRTTNDEDSDRAFVLRPSSCVRLYKTGDLARYRADGAIEYLGRIDQQVKVRGFRIELGEIEVTLLRHPAVREAIAVVSEDVAGDQRLLAYVVLTADERRTTNDEEPDPSFVPELRDFLKHKLPDYMVPAVIVVLGALPLTPSGKIDRQALPPPDQQALAGVQHGYVAPQTPIEEQLAAIWGELLGLQRVGVNDNFFELGGHSLLATRVLSRINEAFDVELPLEVLFTNFTVAELARKIAQFQVTSVDTTELAAMLQQLDSLSDDEVKQLLAGM
jgi:amino acid adenylation domain-containing protein